LVGEAHDLEAFRVFASLDHDASLAHDKSLSKLIENEIIPRLMMAHVGGARCPSAAEIDIGEVAALAELVLEIEADALLASVEAVLARGVGVDTVMVDLLAPAARLLGEYWESDRCDFIDVTMGLWRLQEVVREIAARAPSERLLAAGGHRALFAAMPGNQHNFGTVVMDELFRREGWITERMTDAETSDLLRGVRRDWFDLIGLTVSCDCHIEQVASLIVALRNVSRNSGVCIMVGGPVFSKDPDLAAKIGADGTAADAKLALKVALALVRKREREALAVS
jgi:methanogenic corrinoid protein MtbC1